MQALGVRLKQGSLCQHIYIKEHGGAAGGTDSALFVSGLPLRLQEDHFVRLFSAFGSVQQAVLHSTKVGLNLKPLSMARVVFISILSQKQR